MALVEILAGRERLRFWSDSQERAILEVASTSGSTMTEVARRHDIVPHQIYTWRRQLGLSAPAPFDHGRMHAISCRKFCCGLLALQGLSRAPRLEGGVMIPTLRL